MKSVLIACEMSGHTRDAFARRGWDAWSCDLLPSLSPCGNHIQGDALDAIRSRSWDLVIAHPPCTFLSKAGSRHWYAAGRLEHRIAAFRFVEALYNATVAPVAIENPVGALSTLWRPADQYIEPFFFGAGHRKKTGFWLRGLPPLLRTHSPFPPPPVCFASSNGRPVHWTKAIKSNRSVLRSVTPLELSEAMAEQWGGYVMAGGCYDLFSAAGVAV